MHSNCMPHDHMDDMGWIYFNTFWPILVQADVVILNSPCIKFNKISHFVSHYKNQQQRGLEQHEGD